MELRESVKAFIHPGEQRGYIVECQEISVVTQGDTLDQVVYNLRQAVALHLEGEDPTQFWFFRILWCRGMKPVS